MEGDGHDSICGVESLLDPVAVVNVDVDVEREGERREKSESERERGKNLKPQCL